MVRLPLSRTEGQTSAAERLKQTAADEVRKRRRLVLRGADLRMPSSQLGVDSRFWINVSRARSYTGGYIIIRSETTLLKRLATRHRFMTERRRGVSTFFTMAMVMDIVTIIDSKVLTLFRRQCQSNLVKRLLSLMTSMNIPKAHFTKDNFGGPIIYHSGRARKTRYSLVTRSFKIRRADIISF
jgi:hypothetical protein